MYDVINFGWVEGVVNPLISPWINTYAVACWLFTLIFLVIIRFPASQNSKEEYLRTLALLSYMVSSIIMSNFTSGRHGFLSGILLCVVFATILQQKSNLWLLMFTTLFYITSYFNYPTSYFLYSLNTDKPLSNLLSNMIIRYRSSYTLSYFINSYFMEIGCISFLLILLLILAFVPIIGINNIKNIDNKIVTGVVLFFMLVAILNPVIFISYAKTLTRGNLAAFKNYADWYRSDRMMALDLMNIMQPNERILSYADVILSYYLVKKIDLYHSFTLLNEYCPLNMNVEDLYKCLHEKLNVTYALIPRPNHYAYSNYLEFLEEHPQFQDIFLKYCVKVKDYSRYTFCKLQRK